MEESRGYEDLPNRIMRHVEDVVREFFPDRKSHSIEPFGTGNINDTFKLSLSGKPSRESYYLLQRLNHQVFRKPWKVMGNIERVYRHLSAFEGLSCLLEPIALPSGKLLFEDVAGNYWRVFPFYPGKASPERADTPVQAFEAARSIGRFLACLTSLDPSEISHTIPDFHNSPARYRHFLEQVNTDPAGRLAQVGQEVQIIHQHHGIFGEVVDLRLPQRVVHNDTKISNVLFDADTGKACGLIDWDTIMPGSLLSDFGDMVRSFVSPVEEDHPDPLRVAIRLPIFQALCRGFVPELEGNADPRELDNLVLGALWITLEQAMRFLGDFIAGDIYYKVSRPAHNLDRARNQLALFRRLLERREELETVLASYRA